MLDSNNPQYSDGAPLVGKKGSDSDFGNGNIALSGEVSE